MNRPDSLELLLSRLDRQTLRPRHIVVVDNGTTASARDVVCGRRDTVYLASQRNLGGAGGYAYGIMHAIALGGDLIWIMDDDGYPEDDGCLRVLAGAIETEGYHMVSPLVVDIENPSKLAFFYYREGRPVKTRSVIAASESFPQFAHLFNGALIRADAFERFGLPRYELFFRGDEVDFMFRLRRGGARFATVAATAFLHPSGSPDTHPIMGGRYHAVIPTGERARYYYHRNRGNLFREFRLFRAFYYDLVRYTWFFLITRRGDFGGFSAWARAVWLGWSRRFTPFDKRGGSS